jgi:4-hydroxythreonine-4-phosphate dehydrogenase
MRLPRIALTAGDPAGIGPEIVRKAAEDLRVRSVCQPVLYGPVNADPRRFPPGKLSADAARAAHDAIVSAVQDAMGGTVDAVATAPINKEAFALAGLRWPGHTELLQHLTGARRVAMMFHADALRVVLATVHVPLAQVPEALTRERLRDTIELTAESLPRFGIASPRIALAGLNPHAGEHGVIGREERDVLEPVVAECRARGLDVHGPFPADTVFVRTVRYASGADPAPVPEFDVVVACYHDQGLIPIKLVAFGRAVNVTLGLPIVRTSVDHGTAFDIAGQDRADPSSMIEAVLLAAKLAAA